MLTRWSDKRLKNCIMFDIGGKCLAFHGPLLYEAKILRSYDGETKKMTNLEDENSESNDVEVPEELKDEDCYLIHYQGWKSTWDEWIGHDRIREYNDENIQLRKDLIQEARESKKQEQLKKKKRKAGSQNEDSKRMKSNNSTAAPTSSSSNGSSGSANAGTGVGSGSGTGGSINGLSSSTLSSNTNGSINTAVPKIILHIPNKLKSILVDDWELVTKDKKIIELPSAKPMSAILAEYEAEMNRDCKNLIQLSQRSEYLSGLKQYFNECLPRLLLYRLEKLQYDEKIVKKNINKKEDLCNIYGSIHLLRLISILPELISSTTMDKQNCQLIIKQSESLLLFLLRSNTFADAQKAYVNTSSQYEGIALGM